MNNTYFYSGQIRRFLQQFVRILSNFQVSLGKDRDGNVHLLQVPIYYGDSSRQASSILRNNSENALPTVPAMSIYITGFRYDQKRMQEPFHVSKLQVTERAVDPQGNQTSAAGNPLTVERIMPVPYMLTIKCDIWTSNTDQKLQLFEQIAVLFNPSLDIQSSDNYIDWTSLSYITLTDVNFSSRVVPTGTEDPIDIGTMTFELPVWISPPAKVKNMGVIQRFISSTWDTTDITHELNRPGGGIIGGGAGNGGYGTPNVQSVAGIQAGNPASIAGIRAGNSTFAASGSVGDEGGNAYSPGDLMAKSVYTPVGINILYLGNTLRLIKSVQESSFKIDLPATFTPGGNSYANEYSWVLLFRNYGGLTNGISRVILEQDNATIVGTVSHHPTDESLLLFTPIIDTLPANTLSPVDAIIDPRSVVVDSDILNPESGTRFLILNDIGSPGDSEGAIAWNKPNKPFLVAKSNDIIEFSDGQWNVVFECLANTAVEYITNLRTNTQYKWKDQQWTKSVEGRYGSGAWRVIPRP
ncbi:hypothetical protein UFOVP1636_228 [uncultured Caudovirales phage]|uniref:Tail sheath stabilizer and completion protein n=1 Tax=uncultured Caudovirales phage TaxID=2100421 RepID=A0A6J5T0G4_9CAUD|nr:hypothetical protein UFOVP1636_228 [uncultured Caudovirales phage]